MKQQNLYHLEGKHIMKHGRVLIVYGIMVIFMHQKRFMTIRMIDRLFMDG